MFTGEYRHTVDDKGRIAVPAKFRAQLGAGAVVSRWLDACLAIHTQPGWDALATKVAALPITDQNARRFQRLIFAGAAEVELEGRIDGQDSHGRWWQSDVWKKGGLGRKWRLVDRQLARLDSDHDFPQAVRALQLWR